MTASTLMERDETLPLLIYCPKCREDITTHVRHEIAKHAGQRLKASKPKDYYKKINKLANEARWGKKTG